MEWPHMTFPRNKKFKSVPLARKVMAAVFYENVDILVNLLPRREQWTLTTEMKHYKVWILTFHKFVSNGKNQCCYSMKMPDHTGLNTIEAIATCGCTVLLHPPYSPYLAPSHCHPFGSLKGGLRVHHYMITRHCSTPCARCCTKRTQLVMCVTICSC